MSPAHWFAATLFGAVGLSHTVRPGVWKDYVALLASQGRGGLAMYAVLHALPGAVLVALAGWETWDQRLLRIVGLLLVVKSAVYCTWPGFALARVRRGLALGPAAWSAGGVLWLALAAVAAAGGLA